MNANNKVIANNTKSKLTKKTTTTTKRVNTMNTTDHVTNQPIESLPFPPFLPPQATVMCMGTFPPAADKRAMQFHYPNFQNDMWRVYGLIFFNDKDHFRAGETKAFDAAKIKAFLTEKGIASCPTVWQAIRERGNASDAFLTVIDPVPIYEVLATMPNCQYIGTTGGKATEVLLSLADNPVKLPKTGETIQLQFGDRHIQLTRLPSTSRAYPLSLTKKAEAYKQFFQSVGLL